MATLRKYNHFRSTSIWAFSRYSALSTYLLNYGSYFRNLRKEKSKPNSNSRYLCLCFFHGNIMDCQQNTGNASLSCKQYYIRKCIRIITNCRFSLNARLPICSIYRHFNLSFWKRVTKGKHLWLRNNFSTFSSQFIDTFTVVSLLCIFKVLPWNLFYGLVVSGFLFKVMIAMLDTPLLYAVVFILRKKFGLKPGEEIVL